MKLLFVLTILLFCELITHMAFYILPGETYQRYYIKQDGKDFRKHNGLGAASEAYFGQPFKIAIIGSSDLAADDIPYKSGIVQKLQKLLGPNKVHIDNFSIPELELPALFWQMEHLAKLRRRYDILLISIDEIVIEFPFLNHFSRRWRPDAPFPLAFFGVLKKFFERQGEREPLFNPDLWSEIGQPFLAFARDEGESADELLARAFKGEYVCDKENNIRRRPEIIDRLVSRNISELKWPIVYDHNIMKSIKEKALKISDSVYFAPVKAAYRPDMLPYYHNVLCIVVPSYDFTTNNPTFYDAQTVANLSYYYAKANSAIAQEVGMNIIDFKQAVIDVMDKRSRLMLDEYHVSEEGATVVAQYLAEQFRPLVDGKLNSPKKQSR